MTILRSSHRLPAATPGRGIPDATVARLPVYLRALNALIEQGTGTCSSIDLAAQAGVNPAKLRKTSPTWVPTARAELAMRSSTSATRSLAR